MFRRLQAWLFENHTLSQTIAKNTFWLFSGQMIGRLFRAAIVIYAARVLGAASWGAFSYAIGVAAFLTIFSDIGINALLTKEAARHPELKHKYLATAFFIKLALLAVFVTGVIIAFPHLTKIPEAAALLPIIIFVFAFDTLRDLGSALSRALEKMEIESIITIVTNFLIVVLGFLFLAVSPTSHSLALAYALGSGLGLVSIIIVLSDYFSNLRRNFTASLIKPILTTAWPFALLGIMGAIMLNTDIIMLGWMRSAEEIGYYSAAQKIVYLLYILPGLFASSIFPALSRFAQSAPEKARALLERSVALSLIAALPVALVGVIFGAPIITLLFGAAYTPAIITFQILMATILIVYPSTLIGNAVFAYDKQKTFVYIVGIAILGNVGFNLLLIPAYGIEGSAVATVLTQLITNIIIWSKMKKVNGFKILPQIGRYLGLRRS